MTQPRTDVNYIRNSWFAVHISEIAIQQDHRVSWCDENIPETEWWVVWHAPATFYFKHEHHAIMFKLSVF